MYTYIQVLFGDPPLTKHLDVDALQAKCPVDRNELTGRKKRRNRRRMKRGRRMLWSALEELLSSSMEGWEGDAEEEEEVVGLQLYKLEVD